MIILLLPLMFLSAFATPFGFKSSHQLTLKSLSHIKGEDCRSRIKDLTCLVDPEARETKEVRPCLPGGESYAEIFEKIHDAFPLVLQKVFCSLNVIYIEKVLDGTAYAGLLPEGKVIMGIRQSVLDENFSLTKWATWKEQLSFGGDPLSYELDPQLIKIFTETAVPVNDFLYFVIAHEFGHILDFANKVNDYEGVCPPNEDGTPGSDCEMRKDGWGGISWITDTRPKLENDFSHRKDLCFYWCEGKPVDPSAIQQIYRDLYERSDFISIYATTQPWDDFADSLAYVLIHQNLEANYSIQTFQGDDYDIMSKIDSPLFSRKLNYIHDFLKRTDIVYP